jgi:hypothetical protein
MATNLSVSVTGHGLVERSKQQQRDARTGRLTREAITRDAETNREEILRDTASQPALSRALAPSRPIDTETAPYLRSNRPAASRLPDKAFMLVVYKNIEFTRLYSFRVRLTDSKDRSTVLNGELTFFDPNATNKTYLFLPQGRRLSHFRRSRPFPAINGTTLMNPTFNSINEAVGSLGRRIDYVEPPYSLRPFKPDPSETYTVTLQPMGISENPLLLGSGGVITGYFDKPTYSVNIWNFYDGAIEFNPVNIARGVRWGVTTDAIHLGVGDYYPPGYPS